MHTRGAPARKAPGAQTHGARGRALKHKPTGDERGVVAVRAGGCQPACGRGTSAAPGCRPRQPPAHRRCARGVGWGGWGVRPAPAPSPITWAWQVRAAAATARRRHLGRASTPPLSAAARASAAARGGSTSPPPRPRTWPGQLRAAAAAVRRRYLGLSPPRPQRLAGATPSGGGGGGTAAVPRPHLACLSTGRRG